jgi:hypothetical protein
MHRKLWCSFTSHVWGWLWCLTPHFQQYISYIVCTFWRVKTPIGSMRWRYTTVIAVIYWNCILSVLPWIMEFVVIVDFYLYIHVDCFKPTLYMYFLFLLWLFSFLSVSKRGRRGRDRLVVGLKITYAISTYHHWMSIRERCTSLYDQVWQWLATGRWFSPGPPISSTVKMKVALNTIKPKNLSVSKVV